MKSPVMKEDVSAILNDFDALREIDPSPDWDQSLMNRIALSRNTVSPNSHLSVFSALFFMMILINVGFFLELVSKPKKYDVIRREEINTLSRELFINTTANND
jgi:hypothetical protein